MAIKAINMLQLYTANISYGFNTFRMAASIFPKFGGQNAYFFKFNRPWSQLQKSRKTPVKQPTLSSLAGRLLN